MTTDRRLGAERLSAVFAGDGAHVFLRESGEAWTVERLLALAGDVARAVPADAGPLVAVRSHSTAFVAASLVGLWTTGRSPLLIDPALAAEPSGLRPGGARIHVMAPAGVVDSVGRRERARIGRRAAPAAIPRRRRARGGVLHVRFDRRAEDRPQEGVPVRRAAPGGGAVARAGRPADGRVVRSGLPHPRLHLRVLHAGRGAGHDGVLARRLAAGMGGDGSHGAAPPGRGRPAPLPADRPAARRPASGGRLPLFGRPARPGDCGRVRAPRRLARPAGVPGPRKPAASRCAEDPARWSRFPSWRGRAARATAGS